MSTAEIAHGLVVLCRQGKNLEAMQQYYSPDIISVESTSGPTMPAETHGLDAVLEKSKWWVDNHEIHGAKVGGPYVGESEFAVKFEYDVTFKPTGKRFSMEEVGVYAVAGDKIVHEHFYYNAGA